MIVIESQVAHQLGRIGAVKRVREFVGSLPQRFPQQVHQVTMQVHDDYVEVRFAAYGYMVQWKAEVKESCIVLHGLIPDSARKFQDKMMQTVVDRVSEALQPVMLPLRRTA
jgi:hypothetical protein